MRGLTACAVGIFAETDSFKPGVPQHNPSRTAFLPTATSDSKIALATVRNLFCGFMRDGFTYKKAGVFLADLAKPGDLLTPCANRRRQVDEHPGRDQSPIWARYCWARSKRVATVTRLGIATGSVIRPFHDLIKGFTKSNMLNSTALHSDVLKRSAGAPPAHDSRMQ